MESRVRTAYDVGALVADRRRQLNLTQQQLAQMAGVTKLWVLKLETGQSPEASLRRVLDVMKALDLRLTVRSEDVGERRDG